MDNSTLEFSIDQDEICNFCKNFEKNVLNTLSAKDNSLKLVDLIRKIKKNSGDNNYNCVVGISGGVDSSYLLTQILEYGLNPIVVHMDNGWDSELAQHNIASLVTKLKVDYECHVIYWPEYRDLMQAFFKSNVVDIELLYDNAMIAVNYKIAEKYKIKYIIGGTNNSTEGFRLPRDWSWHKFDKRNIYAIYRKFSGPNKRKISTFPSFGWIDYVRCRIFKGIEWVSPLDLVNYNKSEAIKTLRTNYNYKPYPYKHYESVFTRFYQGYILPKKFGIDKRKIHLSNLILTEQISRTKALEKLDENPYPSHLELQKDINFFLKKMKWNPEELENYLVNDPIPHSAYANTTEFTDKLIKIIREFVGRFN
jgi:N-acetyl sugar amidotransferase